MICVFESDDPVVIAMAKGALEDSGIEYWFDGAAETAARFVLGPIRTPLVRFFVADENEAGARAALEMLGSDN